MSLKGFFFNSIFIVASTTIGLLLAELGTRLVVYIHLADDQFISLVGGPDKLGTHGTPAYLSPPSKEGWDRGDRYYRNTPNLENFSGSFYYRVTHNSFGFRVDRPRLGPAEPANRIRVAILGDSMTWGAIVENDQTYSAVAQRWLDRWAPGHFLIVNAGVAGFATNLFPPFYRSEVRKHGFDTIVIGVYISDFGRRHRFMRPGDRDSYREVDDARAAIGRTLLSRSYFYLLIRYFMQIRELEEIADYQTVQDEQRARTIRHGKRVKLTLARNYEALARTVDEIRADGARPLAFFLPNLLEPFPSGSPKTPSGKKSYVDQPMTEKGLHFNRRQFRRAVRVLESKDVPAIEGFDALLGVTMGQCYEAGRRFMTGHYNVFCNQYLGRRLAEDLFQREFGRPPPPLLTSCRSSYRSRTSPKSNHTTTK